MQSGGPKASGAASAAAKVASLASSFVPTPLGGLVGDAANAEVIAAACRRIDAAPRPPALKALAKRHRFRLLVVGANRPISIDSVECINRSWDIQSEVSDFQSIDIGIYPLPETEIRVLGSA